MEHKKSQGKKSGQKYLHDMCKCSALRSCKQSGTGNGWINVYISLENCVILTSYLTSSLRSFMMLSLKATEVRFWSMFKHQTICALFRLAKYTNKYNTIQYKGHSKISALYLLITFLFAFFPLCDAIFPSIVPTF